MSDEYEYVEKLSRIMNKICLIILIVIPVGHIILWMNIEWAHEFGFLHDFTYQPQLISKASIVTGFSVSGILSILSFLAIYHLRRFFIYNSIGKSFSIGSSVALHKFSKFLIYYSLAIIPIDSALSVIMSMDNPVGERELTITVQTHDLTLIFLGFVLFTISWLMKETVRIAAENAEII